jgi:glycosyltransferase involved in cell wall biosynthesis
MKERQEEGTHDVATVSRLISKIFIDARVTGTDGIGRYTRNLVRHLRREVSNCPGTSLSLLIRDEYLSGEADHCFLDTSVHYTLAELRVISEAAELAGASLVHCTDYRVPLARLKVPLVVSIHDIFRFTHPALCYDDEQFTARNGVDGLRCLAEVTAQLVEGNAESGGDEGVRAPTLHELYYASMLRLAVARADALLVPTETVRRQLFEAFKVECPVLVAPYGINHEENSESNSVTAAASETRNIPPPYFLYVGQARAHKNISKLLTAFQRLAANTKEAKLLLVGRDFGKESSLSGQLRRLGLRDRVLLCGYVADEELLNLYRGASALVHLSSHEGFGFTPHEALAQGTPVIAANTPILRETLGTCVTLVDYNDDDSIAAAMQAHAAFDNNTDARARRVRHATRYRWSQTARVTLKAYGLAAEHFERKRQQPPSLAQES